jgi:phosphate uptake regulator
VRFSALLEIEQCEPPIGLGQTPAAEIERTHDQAFDVDPQEITRLVAEMGDLAEKQVADSIDALTRRDGERARRVLAVDASIGALQREIRLSQARPFGERNRGRAD